MNHDNGVSATCVATTSPVYTEAPGQAPPILPTMGNFNGSTQALLPSPDDIPMFWAGRVDAPNVCAQCKTELAFFFVYGF